MYSPPEPDLLIGIAAQRLRWKDVLGEWIDNALDAAAYQIEIVIDHRYVSVKDNGRGCAHLQKMVAPGSHERHASTKLGRYGIGAKDAALWVGGEKSDYYLSTVHAGKISQLQMNWAEYAASGWNHEDPRVTDAGPDDRGTYLRVEPNTKKAPRDWDDLLDELGYTYSPAIKAGAQITLKGPSVRKPEILRRWELPKFQEAPVDRMISVGGKSARVYCGIVEANLPNPRGGLTYSHGFRVILPACASGCGAFSISRVCGFVELDGSWRLAKNKNEILNAEDLFAAVEEVCLPVLRRAEELGELFDSAAFDSELTSLLQSSLKAHKKAKREPGTQIGTVTPTGTGGEHRRARREQAGDHLAARYSAVRVLHAYLGESEGFGQVKWPNVILNRDNSFIEQTYQSRNREAAWGTVGMLLAAKESFDPQLQFKWLPRNGTSKDFKEFSKLAGFILSGSPPAREHGFKEEVA